MSSAMISLGELVRPFGLTETGVTFVDDAGSAFRLTYDDLARHGAGVAADLVEAGIREGDTVALSLVNTPASFAALLGTWMTGATALSVPPAPRGSKGVYRAGFEGVLEDACCRLLIAPERVGTVFEGAVRTVAPEKIGRPGASVPPDVEVPERALVQFSSGSTGSPKGIVVSADALAGHVSAIVTALALDGERDSLLSWLPPYHDMGLVGFWLTPLVGHPELTLMSPRRFARRPRSWIELCARYRITITAAPNFAYRLAALTLPDRAVGGDLAAIRCCLSGGERVSWATLTDFAEACAPFGLRWEALMPVYGLAEATLAVSFPPLGRGPIRDTTGATSLGRPLPGLEVRERGIGGGRSTLELRGDWLFEGYLDGADVVPATDADGWFSTNDLGYLRDGELYVLGRSDETVIVRGRNVPAEDVEAVAMSVAGRHGIAAAAFRSPDGDDRFALAIELAATADEATALAPEFQAAVTRALEAKVSPVATLRPLSIPRTTSGKVRRAACREMLDACGWRDDQLLGLVR
jgi:acyl-CoA synthetase (AMP-forming)/AMP-acid ligase II